MTHSSITSRTGRRSQRATKQDAPHERPRAPNSNSSKSVTKRSGDLRNRLERYLELARSATMSGDEITAQGHYQHAEHYFRLVNAGAT